MRRVYYIIKTTSLETTCVATLPTKVLAKRSLINFRILCEEKATFEVFSVSHQWLKDCHFSVDIHTLVQVGKLEFSTKKIMEQKPKEIIKKPTALSAAKAEIGAQKLVIENYHEAINRLNAIIEEKNGKIAELETSLSFRKKIIRDKEEEFINLLKQKEEVDRHAKILEGMISNNRSFLQKIAARWRAFCDR